MEMEIERFATIFLGSLIGNLLGSILWGYCHGADHKDGDD